MLRFVLQMIMPVLMLALVNTKPLLADSVKELTFVNKMVGDKKTWVPQKTPIQFAKGQVVTIKLVNQLEAPHGFFINGMTDPILVPGKRKGGVTPELSFSMQVTDKPGDYEFKCHMHPAHVGGMFKVQ